MKEIKTKNMEENIIYAGIFLDEASSEKLNSLVPEWLKQQPDYREPVNKHITVYFHTNPEKNCVEYMFQNKGKNHTIVIDGIGISEHCLAVRVKQCVNENGEITPSTNKTQHITIAVYNGGKPVESNNINLWFSIDPITLSGIGKEVIRHDK